MNLNPCPKCYRNACIMPVHKEGKRYYLKPFCPHCEYTIDKVYINKPQPSKSETNKALTIWREGE